MVSISLALLVQLLTLVLTDLVGSGPVESTQKIHPEEVLGYHQVILKPDSWCSVEQESDTCTSCVEWESTGA